jgi:hypothetical protein
MGTDPGLVGVSFTDVAPAPAEEDDSSRGTAEIGVDDTDAAAAAVRAVDELLLDVFGSTGESFCFLRTGAGMGTSPNGSGAATLFFFRLAAPAVPLLVTGVDKADPVGGVSSANGAKKFGLPKSKMLLKGSLSAVLSAAEVLTVAADVLAGTGWARAFDIVVLLAVLATNNCTPKK